MSSILLKNISKHYQELHVGKNWTWSNLSDALEGVDYKQATTKIYALNTIAILVYHIGYYTTAAIKVLQGGPLEGSDKISFDHPPIESEADWQQLKDRVMSEHQIFAELLEQLPEEKLWETFGEEKYGIYFRNIVGIIEHGHYHLGQIVIIKKILAAQSDNPPLENNV